MRDWLLERGGDDRGDGVDLHALEGAVLLLVDVMETWLLNAAHMKAVPGRKPDVKDAEWIAQLLEHGLLRPSFVPPPDIRPLRMLTRYRVRLMGDRTREATRLEACSWTPPSSSRSLPPA
jgi:transposase